MYDTNAALSIPTMHNKQTFLILTMPLWNHPARTLMVMRLICHLCYLLPRKVVLNASDSFTLTSRSSLINQDTWEDMNVHLWHYLVRMLRLSLSKWLCTWINFNDNLTKKNSLKVAPWQNSVWYATNFKCSLTRNSQRSMIMIVKWQKGSLQITLELWLMNSEPHYSNSQGKLKSTLRNRHTFCKAMTRW